MQRSGRGHDTAYKSPVSGLATGETVRDLPFQFTYNMLGQVTSQSSPDSGTTSGMS